VSRARWSTILERASRSAICVDDEAWACGGGGVRGSIRGEARRGEAKHASGEEDG
jgi:hypothetical protein